jgi:putative sterol carrier protein
MAEEQGPDPAQLAEMIKGLSDDDLRQQIKSLGAHEIVTEIFNRMPEAFLPDKAGDIQSTLQYDITTEGGTESWAVAFDNGTCTTSEGPATEPRLTLGVDVVDFIRLIFGQADGAQLFMGGRLKLTGDMMFAMQMQGFFDRDFAPAS